MNGYRILTMQNTTGKLMGRIVARKLGQGLGRRNALLPDQGGHRAGQTIWQNAAIFANETYERFQVKSMASKGIEKRHLFLLYQSVMLSVIGYGLGLTTLSQSNLLKLDRVQNEAESKSKGISLGCRIPSIHSTMLQKKTRDVG